MRRVIAEVQPRWVVAENVPGLITLALDAVLSDLEALGYTTGAVTVPACAVDAPHRRERLWIVGYADGTGTWQQSSDLLTRQGTTTKRQKRFRNVPQSASADVADTQRVRRGRRSNQSGDSGQGMVQNKQERRSVRMQTQGCHRDATGWWLPEPAICELADGLPAGLVRYAGRVARNVPNRVHKLKALGTAIVPKIAGAIG